jgi:prophage tail gpP-like protein
MSDGGEIILIVGGLRYEGWKEIEVIKSIDNIATTFGFLISEKYPDDQNRWPIKLGQSCSVEIDDIQIANGYVEEVEIRYDAGAHYLNFAGRDVTGDLIDCCHYYDDYPNEWKDQTILSIVEALCNEFGIDVVVDETITTDAAYIIPTFKSNEGDKVFDLINKVCLKKAILPVSYGDGKLTLTRAAGGDKAEDTIRVGGNVLAGKSILSNLERYSKYVIKGQGIGNDNKDLASTVQPKGVAEDDVILRHRPLVLLAESAATNKECEDRGRWESRLRMGKSRLYSYDLQGWLQSNGAPWPLNGLVRVEDNLLGIEDELLISEVTYRLSEDEGRKVSLIVTDPTTYELLDETISSEKATKFDYKGVDNLTLYGPGKVDVINLGEEPTGGYKTGGGF